MFPRIIRHDLKGRPLGELSSADTFAAMRTEEINGQHSLSITTFVRLQKNERILLRDAMGKWREYVVKGTDENHSSGRNAIGTYYCVWSLQHDFELLSIENKRPGVSGGAVGAHNALSALIDGTGTKRWQVGTVSVTTSGGLSMYRESAWKALSDIVSEFGGEVDAEIEVGPMGVVSRKVCLHDSIGDAIPHRRFDYGHDMVSIRRTVADDPVYCRIIPLGKGDDLGDDDASTNGRRITIESVNGGIPYLQNDDAAEVFRVPDGQGGWEYPTTYVTEDSIKTPSELKAWGLAHLDDYTVPKVTYTGELSQFAAAGMDAHGVSLGDAVQCVDKAFYEDSSLRVQGRITKIVVDELDPRSCSLTVGYLSDGFAGMMGGLAGSISGIAGVVSAMNGGTMSTEDYLSRLIDRINSEINATGGYTYLKPGKGLWVYDRAEDDNPRQVVRIMGGSISIANSKDAQGNWNWQTMLTGKDGILASAVTAAHITAGTIKSHNGNISMNLDTGDVIFKRGNISSLDGKSTWNLTTGKLETRNMKAYEIDATGVFRATGPDSVAFVNSGAFVIHDKGIAGDNVALSALTLAGSGAGSSATALVVSSGVLDIYGMGGVNLACGTGGLRISAAGQSATGRTATVNVNGQTLRFIGGVYVGS